MIRQPTRKGENFKNLKAQLLSITAKNPQIPFPGHHVGLEVSTNGIGGGAEKYTIDAAGIDRAVRKMGAKTA